MRDRSVDRSGQLIALWPFFKINITLAEGYSFLLWKKLTLMTSVKDRIALIKVSSFGSSLPPAYVREATCSHWRVQYWIISLRWLTSFICLWSYSQLSRWLLAFHLSTMLWPQQLCHRCLMHSNFQPSNQLLLL